MSGYQSESIDMLLKALTAVQNVEQCRALLEDLCTIKEVQDMAQRFETAMLLSQGRSYQEITAQVGTSTATISRVSRCLNYGSGGYRAAIAAMENTEDAK